MPALVPSSDSTSMSISVYCKEKFLPKGQAMFTEMLPVMFANGCVLHATAPTDDTRFLINLLCSL